VGPESTLSGHSDRHRLNGRFQGATAIHFFESVVNSSAFAEIRTAANMSQPLSEFRTFAYALGAKGLNVLNG
jgi:hypothetical protein